jgi:hypothetical protein
MIDRLRDAIIADPWRSIAVILALSLAGSLGLVFLDNEKQEPSLPAATTTATTLADESTTTTSEASSSTTTTAQTSAAEGIGGLIAVKIDNAPPARPQLGPGEATILVEAPVEGGITRFIAVLPEELSGLAGPIRSLRPVDADLLPAVASVVVSSGGRPFVVQEVVASGVDNIEAGFSSMFVSQGRPDPYDTFVDLDLLETIIDEATVPATGLPSGEVPGDGGPVTEFDLPYEGVSFRYDEGSGYVRLQDGEPFEVLGVDGSGPQPLSHDIVVLMNVAERPAGYSDVNGIPVSTFDVIGSGDLIVHIGGEQFAGTWSRSAHADPYRFEGPNGESLGLPGGSIYVALIPRQAGETDSGG